MTTTPVNPEYNALVVDDDPIIRRMVSFALARRGFACDVAVDGVQAMEQLRVCSYDLLILDLNMPGKHGHAIAVDVLKRDSRPVIIVHTVVQEPRITKDLLARGVDDVIYKPADYEAFSARALALVLDRQAAKAATQSASPSGDERADPAADQPLSDDARALQAKQVVGVLTQAFERSQEIAAALQSDSIETLVAKNTDDLYRLLNRHRIDALIIEHQLEGFLTGIDLFDRLYKEMIRPKSILLAKPDWALQEKADKLHLELIVDPEASPDGIKAVVCGLLAKQGERDAFVPPAAVRLVEDYGEVPPLPQLLIRLTGYLDLPLLDIPLKELARDISVDAKATTELLKMTNASAVGLTREITSVFDAVRLHGPKKTISLILSSAVVGIQSGMLRDWSDPVRIWFQKRSVLMASTAATFASRLGKISADTAFLLGLLQDIGCLVLSRRYQAQYQNVLERIRRVGRVQLQAMEQDEFRINHAEVSAALMLRWGLPQSLIRPVVNHHNLQAISSLSPAEQALTQAMQVGEGLANLADLAHPFRRSVLNRLLAVYGQSREAECRSAMAEAVGRSAELSRVFSLPIPTPEELRQVISRTLEQQAEEGEEPDGPVAPPPEK